MDETDFCDFAPDFADTAPLATGLAFAATFGAADALAALAAVFFTDFVFACFVFADALATILSAHDQLCAACQAE
ncbi:hypothetical protein [Tardiphaga sp.]|uniref:hypothetical protein n=1 Tax=Tardiphaga sp. TaxID=1926292 RepID=UPI00352B021D